MAIYMLLNFSFLLTSLITVQIPSWKYVLENYDGKVTKSHITVQTIAYIGLVTILFPIVAVSVLINSEAFSSSYRNTILEDLEKNG